MRAILLFLIILISGCGTGNMTDLLVLGNDEFAKEKWNVASQSERGKMVASFLKTHDITNMTTQELRSLLGESTAYYEYDEFPAYFIGPKNIESDNGSGYLLAFPIDRKTGKIRKYIIEPPIK